MTALTDLPIRHRVAMLTADQVIQNREIALPPVGAHDVLVRVAATGICGSDLSTYRGLHPYKTAPIVLGHELCGTVVRCGTDVDVVDVGDRVVATAFSACDACDACSRGASNLCGARTNICHQGWDGSFAEYVRLRDNMVFSVDDSVHVEAAAMAEPLSIALHAVRMAGPLPRRSITVLGSGGIGLGCALVATTLGLGDVTCVDRGPAKASLAAAAGARRYVDGATGDVVFDVLAATDGGADVTVVAAGYPGVLDHARAMTRPGGTVVVVTYFDGPQQPELNGFVSAELTVRFSALCTAQDVTDIVAWLGDGTIDPTPLITHRFPIGEVAAAMALFDSSVGEVGKIMLVADPTVRCEVVPEEERQVSTTPRAPGGAMSPVDAKCVLGRGR